MRFHRFMRYSEAMKVVGFVVLFLAGLVLVTVVAGQVGLLKGHPPADLGVRDGRLKPPSLTPNSVSSQAALYPQHPQRSYASIEPLRYSDAPSSAMQRLLTVLRADPLIRLEQVTPEYIHAVARTRILRFADDLEFWLDPARPVIQIRSASRLGRKDLGVNRERLEKIRARFERTGP